MRSPEHHTKSPKESQYGKTPNLHNPNGHQISIICCISALKWPIRVIQKSGKVFLDTRRHLGWYKV